MRLRNFWMEICRRRSSFEIWKLEKIRWCSMLMRKFGSREGKGRGNCGYGIVGRRYVCEGVEEEEEKVEGRGRRQKKKPVWVTLLLETRPIKWSQRDQLATAHRDIVLACLLFFLSFFLSFSFFFTIRNQSTSLMATHNRGFVAPGRAHNAKEAGRKKKKRKENLNVFRLRTKRFDEGGDTSYSDTRFFFILL